jgi:hypothetical protein
VICWIRTTLTCIFAGNVGEALGDGVVGGGEGEFGGVLTIAAPSAIG